MLPLARRGRAAPPTEVRALVLNLLMKNWLGFPACWQQGPLAHGFDTPVWTSERIAALIWSRFRVRYSRDHVHRLLPTLRLEMARTHLAASQEAERISAPDSTSSSPPPSAFETITARDGVFPAEPAADTSAASADGFARMKRWSRPATQVLARRSFEPILDLREPVSDGPCAWPVADFGPPRESLKAGAGRPPYTGGSGSSSTRRSGPLHFLLTSPISAVWH